MEGSIDEPVSGELPALRLRLLNDFSLVCGESPVTGLTSARGQSLLAYLALHRQAPQRRQELAFLFWPDATEAQARNNLRQLMHQLRRAWPAADRYLTAGATAISWRPDVQLLLDDLQWCDQDTLEWLHYLLRFDRQERLLLVGTARTEEVEGRHPLVTLLTDLRRAGLVTEVALTPLDAAETAQLAAQVIGRALDGNQAQHLYRETEGNPPGRGRSPRRGRTSSKPSSTTAARSRPPTSPCTRKTQA